MLKLLQITACLALLTGCAGSAVDLNFRKRVDHVTYGAGIAYSPPMNVTVGPYVTVYYRDPAAAPTTMSPKTLAAITGTSTK